MKALLLHNYYTMKQTWLVQLLVYGIAVLITVVAILFGELEKMSFILSLLVSISLYLPMATVICDMDSDWMKFLITTPISRNIIVQSHYLMVLQYQSILLLVNIVIQCITVFMETPNGDFEDIASIVMSLPLVFMQFGIFYNKALKKKEKNAVLLFLYSTVVVVIYAIFFAFLFILPSMALTSKIVPSNTGFNEDLFQLIFSFSCLLSAPCYFVHIILSYKKSIKIMNEREM